MGRHYDALIAEQERTGIVPEFRRIEHANYLDRLEREEILETRRYANQFIDIISINDRCRVDSPVYDEETNKFKPSPYIGGFMIIQINNGASWIKKQINTKFEIYDNRWANDWKARADDDNYRSSVLNDIGKILIDNQEHYDVLWYAEGVIKEIFNTSKSRQILKICKRETKPKDIYYYVTRFIKAPRNGNSHVKYDSSLVEHVKQEDLENINLSELIQYPHAVLNLDFDKYNVSFNEREYVYRKFAADKEPRMYVKYDIALTPYVSHDPREVNSYQIILYEAVPTKLPSWYVTPFSVLAHNYYALNKTKQNKR